MCAVRRASRSSGFPHFENFWASAALCWSAGSCVEISLNFASTSSKLLKPSGSSISAPPSSLIFVAIAYLLSVAVRFHRTLQKFQRGADPVFHALIHLCCVLEHHHRLLDQDLRGLRLLLQRIHQIARRQGWCLRHPRDRWGRRGRRGLSRSRATTRKHGREASHLAPALAFARSAEPDRLAAHGHACRVLSAHH